MLASLQLSTLPVETIGSVLLVLMASSVVFGWICDAILGDAGPGLGPSCCLAFVGMCVGLFCWGTVTPVRASDTLLMTWTAIGSAFGAVLATAFVRRLTP